MVKWLFSLQINDSSYSDATAQKYLAYPVRKPVTITIQQSKVKDGPIQYNVATNKEQSQSCPGEFLINQEQIFSGGEGVKNIVHYHVNMKSWEYVWKIWKNKASCTSSSCIFLWLMIFISGIFELMTVLVSLLCKNYFRYYPLRWFPVNDWRLDYCQL